MANPFAQLQPINGSMLHQPSPLDCTKGGCLNIRANRTACRGFSPDFCRVFFQRAATLERRTARFNYE